MPNFEKQKCYGYRKSLHENLRNFCGWFIKDKLNIHFSEDIVQPILFGSKRKAKKLSNLEVFTAKFE